MKKNALYHSYIGYVDSIIPAIFALQNINSIHIPVNFQIGRYKILKLVNEKASFVDVISLYQQGRIYPSSLLYAGEKEIDKRLKQYNTSFDAF